MNGHSVLAAAIDWVTISALATAGGTLVLGVATFASVRSANRAARAAEQSLLVGLRPVLMPSRLQDAPEKIGFVDDHWVKVPGGHGAAQVTDGAIYLAIALRNAGNGLAVLHGWRFSPNRIVGVTERPDPAAFRQLSRDLYVPAGDTGFWQGAFRDPSEPGFAEARDAITSSRPVTVDLLYGDHQGGQRVISRFGLTPRDDGPWLATVSRHWNLDRADPR
ncbi:MAG: hypothetical protein QOE72_3377 [Chloroflexota bacterium]|nr:hypothetical protein [Chloroflexota bacterium]